MYEDSFKRRHLEMVAHQNKSHSISKNSPNCKFFLKQILAHCGIVLYVMNVFETINHLMGRSRSHLRADKMFQMHVRTTK